jgi:hypothetical protein
MSPTLAPELKHLLHGMHDVIRADLPCWERILRLARMTGLHGRLAAANNDRASVPASIQRHLLSADRISRFNAQMLHAELHALAPLCTGEFPVIALKGSAYAMQHLSVASGRFVSDVDLLVPRAHVRNMEQRLLEAGWEATELGAYDERYYRDWSHETPPMRFPGHFLEVDLHHAITPVTGSLAFDPAPLFERSEPIPGTPFRTLAAEDQLLHACLHCFHDGDLGLRVREVVDIDGLAREFSTRPGFWDTLLARANELGLERPLWYGLHYASSWLGCPVPNAVMAALRAPSRLTRRTMDRLLPLAMLPSDPDGPPPMKVSLARNAMLVRYHLLRMPLHMLLPHLARKAALRLRARITAKKEAPDNGAP